MVGWSCLRSGFIRSTQSFLKGQSAFGQSVRHGGDHRTMTITPSRWQWHKFKDLVHFYTWMGIFPVAGIIFYSNVFIGPAKLAEIPEGYEPKHWEYHRHPITRFLARYVINNPQQEYEKYLHQLYEDDEKMKIRRLESQVTEKMKEKADYQAYYYQPVSGKYTRIARKHAETVADVAGFKSPD